MSRLIDFLPLDHPLRQATSTLATADGEGVDYISRNDNPGDWSELYLITYNYPSPTRTVVSQDPTGKTVEEVVQFAYALAIAESQRLDLVQGLPVMLDEKTTIVLGPRLPDEQVGQFKNEKKIDMTTAKQVVIQPPTEVEPAPNPRPEPLKTGWGVILKEARTSGKTPRTQSEVSRRLGYTYNCVPLIEGEKRVLSAVEYRAFCEFVGCKEDYRIPTLSDEEVERRARRGQAIQQGRKAVGKEQASASKPAKTAEDVPPPQPKPTSIMDMLPSKFGQQTVKPDEPAQAPVVKAPASAPAPSPAPAPIPKQSTKPAPAPKAPEAALTHSPAPQGIRELLMMDLTSVVYSPKITEEQLKRIRDAFNATVLHVILS